MANFATVEQLESRWRPLSATEKTQAGVLLADASAQLRAECHDVDSRIVIVPPATAPILDPLIPERIVCSMVKRSMIVADDAVGIASQQETTGPFSQSFNYSNPMGDLYLTKAEKRLLGCGGARAFMIDTLPPRAEVNPWLT